MLSRIVAILHKNSMIIAYEDVQGLQYRRIDDETKAVQEMEKSRWILSDHVSINLALFSNSFFSTYASFFFFIEDGNIFFSCVFFGLWNFFLARFLLCFFLTFFPHAFFKPFLFSHAFISFLIYGRNFSF